LKQECIKNVLTKINNAKTEYSNYGCTGFRPRLRKTGCTAISSTSAPAKFSRFFHQCLLSIIGGDLSLERRNVEGSEMIGLLVLNHELFSHLEYFKALGKLFYGI